MYQRVWQTWDLVTSTPTPTTPTCTAPPSVDVRKRVQQRRVERRLPLHELASLVHCDVTTLALFERGEAVLPPDAHARLWRTLRLDEE